MYCQIKFVFLAPSREPLVFKEFQINIPRLLGEESQSLPFEISIFSQGTKKHQFLFVKKENLKNIFKVNLKHYSAYGIIHKTQSNILALKVLQQNKELIILIVPVGHDNRGTYRIL